MFSTCMCTVCTCTYSVYRSIQFEASLALYIHCMYTGNTCTYIVCTCYVHVLWFTYSPSTSYIQFLTFLSYASWQESSILYIDCLDHTQTTLIPVGTGYTQLSRIWSGSVQVVRILWLFWFSGIYMYIRVNTLYIHCIALRARWLTNRLARELDTIN